MSLPFSLRWAFAKVYKGQTTTVSKRDMYFMTKHFPQQVDSNFNVLKLIKKFDANNDGILNETELVALLTVRSCTQCFRVSCSQ